MFPVPCPCFFFKLFLLLFIQPLMIWPRYTKGQGFQGYFCLASWEGLTRWSCFHWTVCWPWPGESDGLPSNIHGSACQPGRGFQKGRGECRPSWSPPWKEWRFVSRWGERWSSPPCWDRASAHTWWVRGSHNPRRCGRAGRQRWRPQLFWRPKWGRRSTTGLRASCRCSGTDGGSFPRILAGFSVPCPPCRQHALPLGERGRWRRLAVRPIAGRGRRGRSGHSRHCGTQAEPCCIWNLSVHHPRPSRQPPQTPWPWRGTQ